MADDTNATSRGRRPATGSSAQARFDPAFADAVAEGRLTAWQALERGRREAYVSRLCERHALPRDAAYAVADNRTSLFEALRDDRTRSRAARRIRGAFLVPAWTALVALPLVVVAALALRAPGGGPADARLASVLGGATVTADAGGQILKVTGPNPRSVLRAYCNAGGASPTLEGVSLIPAAVHTGRARLGLLLEPSEPGNLLTILIEEDREEGNWFVGDGVTSVLPEPAPQGAYRGPAAQRLSGHAR